MLNRKIEDKIIHIFILFEYKQINYEKKKLK